MYNILIEKNEEDTKVVVVQDGKVVEVYNEKYDEKRLEGNIYLGKVKDIIPGMQAAFIDIGENKNALIHIKDLLDKESTTTGNVNLDISNINIKDILKTGDNIVVQVKRDCSNQKGPRVTRDIKINGNFGILMPNSQFITVSQKIEKREEAERLKNIIKENLNPNYGMIIRTAANGRTENDIVKDIKCLERRWEKIKNTANDCIKSKNIPKKIFDNNGIVGKIVTDLAENNLEKIYTNDYTLQAEFKDINNKIVIEENILDKFDAKRIMEFKKKCWLKCGGFITIDVAEALTAIDVNSGKFEGKKEVENNILKVNLEATKEIAYQIRLRDIGGIIIIDYIDMKSEEDRNAVKKYMIECLKNDRTKVQVMDFTKLGLLEITRKHILGR